MARSARQQGFVEFQAAVWGTVTMRPHLVPDGDRVRLTGVVPIDVDATFPDRETAERAVIRAIQAFRAALREGG